MSDLPLLWDDIRRLHQIVGHLLAAANGIDEFGVGMGWAPVSEALQERQGVTLRKLRECCDEMSKIENEQIKKARQWEENHLRYSPGDKVKTVKPEQEADDWTPEAIQSRQWDVIGTIVTHHDSHGLTYEVKHPDGSIGHYEHHELQWIE